MKRSRFANIAIHFDSLSESLDLVGVCNTNLRNDDPAYFKVADRFFSFAERYNFKFTIFIIGKDLKSPEIFEQVKKWHNMGHEIANHSYSHIHNLGKLPYKAIKKEVMGAHDIIFRCTGKEPKGFAAPAWNISRDLVDVLIKANYTYDASMFPTYFMQLFSLKSFLTSAKKKRFGPFSRSDKLLGLFGNQGPHYILPGSLLKKQRHGLIEFPVPTTKFLRLPCYHSMYFIFGRRIFDRLIKSCLKSRNSFYYVMHPLDLFDSRQDLGNMPGLKINNIERALVPLPVKTSLVDSALGIIAENSDFITLEAMAQNGLKIPMEKAY